MKWPLSLLHLLLAFVMCPVPSAAEGQTPAAGIHAETMRPAETKVLVLHNTRREAPAPVILDRVLQQTLVRDLPGTLDYHSEYFDSTRFPDPAYRLALRDFLKHKYAGYSFDILVLWSDQEMDFVSAYGDELFGDVPVVFYGVSPAKQGPRSTGLTLTQDLARTIRMVTQLQPETKRVFVVSGSSNQDKWYENLARAQLRPFEARLEFTYWSGLSMAEILERVAHLPPHSVLYPLMITVDGSGRRFLPVDAFDRIVAAANVPVYAWATPQFDRGAVGGSMFSLEVVATRMADLTVRVLRGENPENIPIVQVDANVDELDWRQLRRWGISEGRVPAGTIVRFREPGVFERYRGYILSVLALLLLQTALIAGLLVQRRNRRLAESSLRESEERFRLMADTAPVMVWRSGPDQLCDFFNKLWLDFRGRSLAEEIGEGWTEGVHPEDLDRTLSVYTAAFSRRQPFRMEYRLRRFDGEYHWVLDNGVPRFATDGTFLGYIGSCFDISERRKAEEALRANEAALRQSHSEIQDLAGRLIAAQEQERARIARDLHDDISQQLAAISIALSGCKRRPETRGRTELLEVLTVAQRQTVELAEEIRLLSHDLHPGVIKHAGLVDAVRSHCREFAQQHALSVVVDAEGNPIVDDMTIALCLYRIVQEALRNVARHAEARQVHVIVQGIQDEVSLTVADDGKGFNLTKVREHGGGLGLRSIDERVRLVGGQLSIETAPGMGTTLTVLVKNVPSAVRDFARV
jgi:PAS domain S-box-containing protein